MQKVLILDRDGVINFDSDAYIKSVDEWQAIPNSLEAMAKLSQAGWALAVATNQSGVGRGYYSLEVLEAMHAKMQQQLAELGGKIDCIAFCPHLPTDNCTCRKPLPGLLDEIAENLNIDLTQAYLVGDSLRDIQAGRARGCTSFLVLTGKGEDSWQAAQEKEEFQGLKKFEDLAALADYLLTS